LSTGAWVTCFVTSIASSPSPYRSSVAVWAQDDVPQLCADHAVVLHPRRDQSGEAGLLHGYPALVDDGRVGPSGLIEHHAPGHEILVADAGRRDDDTLGLHLGALGEQHAGWIDQHDLAVRRDLAGDLRRIGAGHTVQRHRAGRWLLELDLLFAADVEAAPVDRGALRRLVDLRQRGGLADSCGARDDPSSLGLRIDRGLRGSEVCGGDQDRAAQQRVTQWRGASTVDRIPRCCSYGHGSGLIEVASPYAILSVLLREDKGEL
jgi:hypothetical protein